MKIVLLNEDRSSTIAGFEYDDSKKTLVVEFKNKSRYRYLEVPEKTVEELENADSVGKYFSANIRNKFYYEKV